MEAGLIIELVTLALSVLIATGTAIWIVGKISSATDMLNNSIGHLEKTVRTLEGTIAQMSEHQRDQGERITWVEAMLERSGYKRERERDK
jgi:prefoldin subunit 5